MNLGDTSSSSSNESGPRVDQLLSMSVDAEHVSVDEAPVAVAAAAAAPDHANNHQQQEQQVDGNASVIPADQNTGALTVGGHGILPHLFRRSYHVVLFTAVPFVYYWYCIPLGQQVGFAAPKVVALIAIAQIVLEAARIRQRFVCFGFRSYERTQISAQAWGTVGACLVLIAAPQVNGGATGADRAVIGMPILWTLGIVDPLLGELKGHGAIGRRVRRGRGFTLPERTCLAVAVAWLIWALIGVVTGRAVWWIVALMGPIAVAAEYPKLVFIDDNAMMELVPLATALLLEPFFPGAVPSSGDAVIPVA
ncbi:Dolichol kinase [Plasmodiophora brassicae]